MGSGELFDVAPLRTEAATPPAALVRPPGIGAAAWLTLRQRALMDGGLHPLTLVLDGPLRLHPDAAPPGDPRAAGLRCRMCAWHRPGRFPKCHYPNPADRGRAYRTSQGPATDCRGTWPACETIKLRPELT